MKTIRLKKNADRRIRAGHPWVFSNEIDTAITPMNTLGKGEEVLIESAKQDFLGVAFCNPHSLISARIFSREKSERLNTEFFKEKIEQAFQRRNALFNKPYYRLIFSEADGIPGLIIDRFAHHFVCQINTAGIESHLPSLIEALTSFPEVHSIVLRNDAKAREQEGLELYVKTVLGKPDDIAILEENHIQFSFPLLNGQKTGWFYDHRNNRERFCHYAKNKTVLDVFSYLGAWGIQAACADATSVDCIESSAFACEFIKKNAALNHVENKITIMQQDAFDAMKTLLQNKKSYDLIVLDPPAFIKRFKDRKEGIIAYQRINEYALKLLNHNGILFSCSCSMHLGMDDFIQVMQRAAFNTGSTLHILERGHQSPDHPVHLHIPETDYLKVLVIRKI